MCEQGNKSHLQKTVSWQPLPKKVSSQANRATGPPNTQDEEFMMETVCHPNQKELKQALKPLRYQKEHLQALWVRGK